MEDLTTWESGEPLLALQPPLIREDALGWDSIPGPPPPPAYYTPEPVKWEFVFPRGCKPGDIVQVTHRDAPDEIFTVKVPKHAGPGDHMYYYAPNTRNGYIGEECIVDIVCAQ